MHNFRRQYVNLGLALSTLVLIWHPVPALAEQHALRLAKGPPAHAPAHGYRAKHNYRYYPGAEIYFDINRNLYFYLQDNKWLSAPTPPALPGLNLKDFVILDLDTDQPFTRHDRHLQLYPPKIKLKTPKK